MNYKLIKQLESNTHPIQKEAKKAKQSIKRNMWKLKLLSILLGMGLAFAFSWYLFRQMSEWYDEHKVTFPKPIEITLKFPVKIEIRYRTPIKGEKPRKQAVDEQILISQQRMALVERIYQVTRYLESEIGFNQDLSSTHVYCESIGKVNQIGYLVEGNKKFCFKDEKDQRDTFTKWFNKRLDAGMSYAEAVCLYNNGRREPMCRRSIDLNL